MAKKSNQFSYTRQYHISLNKQQMAKFEQAIQTQNSLYQYTLRYLNKTYGRKHIGRPLPYKKQVNYLINHIKAMFIQDKYRMKRWSVRKLGLSSHAADEFLKTVFSNFSMYRKCLVEASRMTDIEKYNFRMNITKDKYGKHKNSQHRSWYRKGSLGFLRAGKSFRTITSQVLPKGGTKLVSPHHINIADFNRVMVFENLKNIPWDEVALTKIKRMADDTFRLQISFTHTKKRVKQSKAVGVDWNMYHNKIFHTSDNQKVYLPTPIVQRANSLEEQINCLKSLRDLEKNKHGHSRLWHRYDREQRYLFAKRKHLLTNEYRHLVHQIVDNYDTIIIEKLNAYEMRKQKHLSKKQNAGKNRRLATIKPYELMTIMESLVNKQDKTLIKVDSYKTSQVEYGTQYESKHNLNETNNQGERKYISEYTGKVIDRDLNAAQNIKEWGLHPEKHVKLKYYPKLKPQNLVEVI